MACAALVGSLTGCLVPWGFRASAWALSTILILMVLGFRRSPAALPLLVAAAFCTYAARAETAMFPQPGAIANWVPRRDVIVEGRLAGHLQAWPQYQTWSGVLACDRISWQDRVCRVSGKLRFQLPGRLPAWNPGDRVRIRGRLQPIRDAGNPGEFDSQAYDHRRGIGAVLKGLESGDAERLEGAPPWSWGAIAAGLRRRWSEGILACAPPRTAGLINALATGDRSGLSPRQNEDMAAAGLAHLLAVSGMNVGIVFVSVTAVAGWMRLPRWLAVALGLLGVGLLVLCTGAEAPVVRAGLMAAGMSMALVYGRTADSVSGLAFSALLILAGDPAVCLDPGFQLSYAATAAVLAALRLQVPRIPVIRPVLQTFLISCSAFVFTLPLTIYYFSSVVPAGLLTNLAAAPLLDVIVIGATLAGIGHEVWPAMGRIAGQAAGWAAEGLRVAAGLGLQLPWGRVFMSPPSAAWVAGFYALLGLALVSSRLRTAAMVGLGAWLLALPCFRPQPPAAGELRLTFLSLAVGESALLETRDQRWLVDTGSEVDFLRRVKPFLASQGINRLDGLWLSHWDDDHAAGSEACLQYFHVKQLLTADLPRGRKHAEPVPRGRTTRVAMHRRDYSRRWGQTVSRMLWPPPGPSGRSNAHCLVAKFSEGRASVLLAGDSPSTVEDQWPDADCTVLKVAHHGSRFSSSREFLTRTQSELAVVSPGNSNPFGFPHPETMARLAASCPAVISTREHGAVRVTLRPGRPARWEYWH